MHLNLDEQQTERLIPTGWAHEFFMVTERGGSRHAFGDEVSRAYDQYVAGYDFRTHIIGVLATIMGIAWVATAFGPLHAFGPLFLILAVSLGLWALRRIDAWNYCGSAPYRSAGQHARTMMLRRVVKGEITVTGTVPSHEVEYLPRELQE